MNTTTAVTLSGHGPVATSRAGSTRARWSHRRTGVAATILTLALAAAAAGVTGPGSAPQTTTIALQSAPATATSSSTTSSSATSSSATSSSAAAGSSTSADTAPAIDSSGSAYYSGRAKTTVGQINSPAGACTATLVGSDYSAGLLVTAAHCVYNPRKGVMAGQTRTSVGWHIDDMQFAPGRTGDSAPYELWNVDQAFVSQAWMSGGDNADDVAFIRLAPQQDQAGQVRTARDVLGAQGISFPGSVRALAATTVLGYPAEGRFDGTSMRRCAASSATPRADVGGDFALTCAMTPGSSGGPWLQNFNATTGAGDGVAVTSVLATDGSGVMAGTPLGQKAYALYQQAQG